MPLRLCAMARRSLRFASSRHPRILIALAGESLYTSSETNAEHSIVALVMLTRIIANVSQSYPFTFSTPRSCSFLIPCFWSTSKEKTSIQKLPREVLAEIFTFCLPGPGTLEDEEKLLVDSFPSIRAAPLNVAAVSRSWRGIALSLPRLWVRLNVSRRQVWCMDTSSREMVRTWLRRSRRSPLELRLSSRPMIEFRGTDGSTSQEELGSIMGLFEDILEHRRRWRSIHIEMETEFDDSVQRVELNASEMPLLEDLYVRIPSSSPLAHINLSLSRRIRKLSLSCDFTMVIGRSPFIHLKSINLNFGCPHKDIAPVFMEDLYMILNHAPNLEELCAVVYGELDTLHATEDKDMRFPLLRKLALHFQNESYSSVESALRRLLLPTLKELEITVDAHLGLDTSLGIGDLLSRSGTSLDSFRLRASSIVDVEVLTCLYLTPNLTHLSLHGFICNMGAIVSALNPRNSFHSEPLCPKLEKLELYVSRWHKLYKNFTRMVVSRWNSPGGSCRLREVRLREQDVWFVRNERRIERCIREGLVLIAYETSSM